MHDHDIELVLKSAGAREKPPSEVESAVRDGLLAEWRALVARRRGQRRRRAGMALAAGVAAAAIGAWFSVPQLTGTGATVGSITLASGDVQVKTGIVGGWSPAVVGQTLAAGQAMETGPAGRSALVLRGGISARLDGDTRLTLASAGELVIDRGALYIDAGPAAAAAPRLDVTTPAGSVRHVGTQYEVRLMGSGVRLRVREGRVEWQTRTGAIEQSRGGEQLTIAGDGSVEREATPLYGESWDWVAATTPVIEIEGLPLADFLAWAARELGREIQFDSRETAQEAASIVLHGSIGDLTPAQALEVVLATTHLRAFVAEGEIQVQGEVHPSQPGN